MISTPKKQACRESPGMPAFFSYGLHREKISKPPNEPYSKISTEIKVYTGSQGR
jgi:hypothetical protein